MSYFRQFTLDFHNNWVLEYLEGRSHRTKFVGVVSAEEFINASIVHGSGTGPVNFVVTISKLNRGIQPIGYLNMLTMDT